MRCVVPISAHTEEALQATCGKLAAAVKGMEIPNLANIAHTVTFNRSHNPKERPHRAGVVAADVNELVDRLTVLASGESDVAAPTGRVVGLTPKLAFVFTGQGSQTVGMGRGLFDTSLAFHTAMTECDRILTDNKLLPGGMALVDTLYGPEDACEQALSNAGFLQPALLSVEYSLAKLVEEELHVKPAVMMGHSLGEITACAVSGIYSLTDALTLAAVRGAAMGQVPAGQGGMAAVRLSKEELDVLLPEIAPSVSVAAVNAPGSSVISGPIEELKHCIATMKERGKKVKQLVVTHGFHSCQIEGALPKLRAAAMKLTARPPTEGITVISNVTGKVQTTLPDADYWVNHARGTVLFMDGAQSALKEGVNVFLELGPQPHLTVQLNGIAGGHKKPVAVVSTLQVGKDDAELIAAATGSLYNAGIPLDWERLAPSGNRIRLPATAMCGKQHWLDLKPTKQQLEAQRRSADPTGPVFRTVWKDEAVKAGKFDVKSCLVVGDKETSYVHEVVPELKKHKCVVGKLLAPLAELTTERLTAALKDREKWDAVIFVCKTNDYVQAPSALLRLLQAASSTRRATRLLILTRGVHNEKANTSGLDVNVSCQAGLWGLAKSARLEISKPLIHCADIDETSTRTGRDVVAELSCDTFGLDNVRLPGRNTGRRVERAEEMPQVPRSVKFTPPPGPIIITGGTGALGLQLSEWLIKRGSKKIILLSRRGKVGDNYKGLWETVQATAARLQAEVELQVCDISDQKQTEAMLKENAAGLKRGGFIHCAGILDDGLLRTQTEERYAGVLVPKVGGLLHALKDMMSRGIRPPLFLLFSSVTAYMGNVGQTSYGAANAMLDSIARQLRAAQVDCTSVQWGPWGGHGMAAFMDEDEGVNVVWKPLTGAVGWTALDTVCVHTQHFAPLPNTLPPIISSLYPGLLARRGPRDVRERLQVRQPEDVHGWTAVERKVLWRHGEGTRTLRLPSMLTGTHVTPFSPSASTHTHTAAAGARM